MHGCLRALMAPACHSARRVPFSFVGAWLRRGSRGLPLRSALQGCCVMVKITRSERNVIERQVWRSCGTAGNRIGRRKHAWSPFDVVKRVFPHHLSASLGYSLQRAASASVAARNTWGLCENILEVKIHSAYRISSTKLQIIQPLSSAFLAHNSHDG